MDGMKQLFSNFEFCRIIKSDYFVAFFRSSTFFLRRSAIKTNIPGIMT